MTPPACGAPRRLQRVTIEVVCLAWEDAAMSTKNEVRRRHARHRSYESRRYPRTPARAWSVAVETVQSDLARVPGDLATPRRDERAQVGARLDRLAHRGVAGEDVDGQPVGDVLVRRLLPREAIPVQRDDVLQQRERGEVGQVAFGVGDVDLEAAAHLALPLVERGLEVVLAQHEAGQATARE